MDSNDLRKDCAKNSYLYVFSKKVLRFSVIMSHARMHRMSNPLKSLVFKLTFFSLRLFRSFFVLPLSLSAGLGLDDRIMCQLGIFFCQFGIFFCQLGSFFCQLGSFSGLRKVLDFKKLLKTNHYSVVNPHIYLICLILYFKNHKKLSANFWFVTSSQSQFQNFEVETLRAASHL